MKQTIPSEVRDLADDIARDIQSGLLSPGMWLKQIDLERRYDATRIDVRRALDKLTLKRLVVHVPNRGYHVHQEDPRRSLELHEVRAINEAALMERLVGHVNKTELKELRRLARRFADLVMDGTLLEQHEANIAFHMALAAHCPNRELANLVLELRQRGGAAPATQWKTRKRIEQSAKEHLALLDALEAGDVRALRALVRAHILQDDAAA